MMKLDNETFHFIVDCSICIIGFFMFVEVVDLAIQILIQKKDYTENKRILRMYIWDAFITLMLLLAINANSVYTTVAAAVIMSGIVVGLFYEIMFKNLVTDKIMMYKFIFWISSTINTICI